jgi:Tfp pilus assembly protein PilE
VADFGLAKIIGGESGEPAAPGHPPAGSTTLTDAGKVMGTPQYMSPEQKENPGEVDHRADIYALGVVFYQMLTGELPGKRIEPPSKKVQIDVRLDEIVLRALEKKPELRFQQASVFKTQLETIAETPPPNKTVPPLLNKSDTFLRWFAVTTLAMIVVLLIIAVLGLIAAVAIPNFIKAREKSLALNQQQVKTTPETSSNFSIGQAYFPRGDSIEITSVERTENQITVKGHYHLVSADNATLTLNITTRAPSHHSQDPKQSQQIVNGEGDFELIHSHVEPGMPHVNMYYGGRPFAELYFGTKEEADREANMDLQHEQLEFMDDATLGFNPVIETVVESGDVKKGYDLDRARVDYVGNSADSRADLAVRESPDGKQTLYFVGTRAELMSDGDARWRMASWVLATNLAIIPESPEAFTNVYGLSWHEAVIPQPSAHPETYEVETYEFQTREGNRGVLQVMGLTENPRGVKIRYKLMRKTIGSPAPPQSADGNQPAASAETWSPELKSGEKPDLQKIRDQIQSLMNSGDYEGALQRQIWYFNHALEFGEVDPVRLSFGINNWAELGRRYPKAKLALTEIRDRDVQQFASGNGYFALFSEIENINRELQDENSTETLFHSLEQSDPKLAQQCYPVIADQLAQRGEYETCRKYMGDPLTSFEIIRSEYELNLENQKHMAAMSQITAHQIAAMNHQPNGTNQWSPPDNSAFFKRNAESRFIGQTRQLIEILVATDNDLSAAQDIQNKALSVLNVPQMQSAMSDAEEKIRNARTRTANK